MPVLLHPKSVGEVLLRSINPEDPPLIQPNYLTHHRDVETLYQGNAVSWLSVSETVLTLILRFSSCHDLSFISWERNFMCFRNRAGEEVVENRTHAEIGGKVK
jgi:hypothetical protein